MRITAFIIASLRNVVNISDVMTAAPSLRARRSAAFLIPLRTKSGDVCSRAHASSLHRTVSCGVSHTVVRTSSLISENPWARARSSASALSICTTNSVAIGGVPSTFFISLAVAPSVHGISARGAASSSAPSCSTFSISSTLTSMWPRSRATSSAIRRTMSCMKPGTVANRVLAACVHGSSPLAIWSAASRNPASPPIGPIEAFFHSARCSAVMTAMPSSRARFSASFFTIPRKNTGASFNRSIAASFQRTSVSDWVPIGSSLSLRSGDGSPAEDRARQPVPKQRAPLQRPHGTLADQLPALIGVRVARDQRVEHIRVLDVFHDVEGEIAHLLVGERRVAAEPGDERLKHRGDRELVAGPHRAQPDPEIAVAGQREMRSNVGLGLGKKPYPPPLFLTDPQRGEKVAVEVHVAAKDGGLADRGIAPAHRTELIVENVAEQGRRVAIRNLRQHIRHVRREDFDELVVLETERADLLD